MSGIKGQLVLFRHGQTDYNENHLLTGTADAQLTPKGEEQARAAGRLLQGVVRIDTVYSSTLSRAFNTAVLALGEARQPHLVTPNGTWDLTQDSDIVEIDCGDFTGRSHKTDPEVVAWKRHFYKPLPNGESDAMALVRIRKFYEREILPRLMQGETVMVVAHAGVVRLFDHVVGKTPVPQPQEADAQAGQRRPILNATPVIFDFVDGRLAGETVLGAEQQATPPAPRPPRQG